MHGSFRTTDIEVYFCPLFSFFEPILGQNLKNTKTSQKLARNAVCETSFFRNVGSLVLAFDIVYSNNEIGNPMPKYLFIFQV